MRILTIADIPERLLYDAFAPDDWRGRVDLIISCGDLDREYLEFLVTELPVPVLYVPGNHDGAYRTQPPEGCEDLDGRLVTIDGLRVAGIGGSPRYNADHEAYQYTEQQMAWRLRRLGWRVRRAGGVDVVVSHAPRSITIPPSTPRIVRIKAAPRFAASSSATARRTGCMATIICSPPGYRACRGSPIPSSSILMAIICSTRARRCPSCRSRRSRAPCSGHRKRVAGATLRGVARRPHPPNRRPSPRSDGDRAAEERQAEQRATVGAS